MGAWEVGFNSWENDGTFLSANGWINPMTWGNGIGNLLFEAPAEDNQKPVTFFEKSFKKFSDTFKNIAILHPFFSFGRVGKNPFTDVPGNLSQRLMQAGTTNLRRGNWMVAAAQQGTAKGMQYALVMPLTIKTFGAFERAAGDMAEYAGFVQPATGVDKNGAPTYVNAKDQFLHSVFNVLGFLNAPIHASQSSDVRFLNEKMNGAAPRLSDRFKPARVVEARQTDALRWSARIRSATEGTFRFMDQGRAREVSGDELNSLIGTAHNNLVFEKSVQEQVPNIQEPAYLVVDADAKEAKIRTAPDASAPKPADQMGFGEAVQVVLADQAGKGLEISADKKADYDKSLAEAKSVLGMNGTHVLVDANEAFLSAAQNAYVSLLPTSTLHEIVKQSSNGKLSDGLVVRAVARLNGSEVAGFWINAKTNGLVGDKLVDLGINGKRSEAVSKNKLGETVIHLGDGDLSPAMSKQLGVLLEGKTAEIVLSGSGGIRIIGVTSAEIKNSQLFSAGNSNRGSPSGHAPALDALSDFGLDSNLTVKIPITQPKSKRLATKGIRETPIESKLN
jgi:hypothetical protein